MDSSDSSGGKPEEPAEDEETTTTTTMTMIRAAVEAVHSSPAQAVLYLTGGASQALGWLMSVPGASSTVLEAVVPYSRMSTIQLLGKNPAQFCSKQVAEELALLAYNRALKLSRTGITLTRAPIPVDLVGEATDRKRSKNRAKIELS